MHADRYKVKGGIFMRIGKFSAMAISLAVACCAVPCVGCFAENTAVYAQAEYTEGTYGVLTYRNYGDYIEISDCDDSAVEVEIPAEINGVPVTSIGFTAFHSCVSLESITLPDSLEKIGGYSFYHCYKLKSIVIPDNVSDIGSCAFESCRSLNSVTLPEGLEVLPTKIFAYCSSLMRVVIPDSVSLIEGNAFRECTSLAVAELPEHLNEIETAVFYGCTSLRSAVLPEGLKTMGASVFYNCSQLEYVNIPSSLEKMGWKVYDETEWFNNQPDGSVYLGKFLLQYKGEAPSKTIITINEGTEYICSMAFDNCEGITEIIIPESVKVIDDAAFSYCSDLIKLTIKNPVCILGNETEVVSNGYNSDDYKSFFNGTIYGYTGSTAQAYAEKYDINFLSIGNGESFISLGDVDLDGVINSSDASKVLSVYAITATGGNSPLSDIQKTAADVNKDSAVDSSDASSILAYYAFTATGGEGSIEEFLG